MHTSLHCRWSFRIVRFFLMNLADRFVTKMVINRFPTVRVKPISNEVRTVLKFVKRGNEILKLGKSRRLHSAPGSSSLSLSSSSSSSLSLSPSSPPTIHISAVHVYSCVSPVYWKMHIWLYNPLLPPPPGKITLFKPIFQSEFQCRPKVGRVPGYGKRPSISILTLRNSWLTSPEKSINDRFWLVYFSWKVYMPCQTFQKKSPSIWPF